MLYCGYWKKGYGVFMDKFFTKYADNAKTKIMDFPEEKSLNIQMDLIGDNSISWGEMSELQNKSAEDLWEELEDVPIDEEENIDEDFYSFTKGTSRYEIWSWFEEAFGLSVAINLMHLEEGGY